MFQYLIDLLKTPSRIEIIQMLYPTKDQNEANCKILRSHQRYPSECSKLKTIHEEEEEKNDFIQ